MNPYIRESNDSNYFVESGAFKQAFLQTIGDSEEIRKILDEGDEKVDELFNQYRSRLEFSLSPQNIINCIKSGHTQSLCQTAEKKLAVDQLYYEWCLAKAHKEATNKSK